MKRYHAPRRVGSLWIPIAAVFLIAVFGYVGRGTIRDVWASILAPKLPTAQPYQPRPVAEGGVASPSAPSPFEGGYATSQNYVMESSPIVAPKPTDPLAFTGTLPDEVNLAVPFTTQAPYSDWNEPYQNACEEASAIMVNAFYQGKTGKIAPADADIAIKKLVAYENATFGDYKDTNADQTAQFLRDYYGFKTVLVKSFKTIGELKQVLALGYPIIIPADGRLLGNPNYRNGGPAYHMLVLRGYTPDLIITNDAGTRNGLSYTYSYETILNATHDWTGNEATMATGRRVMIVVIPNAAP